MQNYYSRYSGKKNRNEAIKLKKKIKQMGIIMPKY